MAVGLCEMPPFDAESLAKNIGKLQSLPPGEEADQAALYVAYYLGNLGGRVSGLEAQVVGLKEEIERLKDELSWRSS